MAVLIVFLEIPDLFVVSMALLAQCCGVATALEMIHFMLLGLPLQYIW